MIVVDHVKFDFPFLVTESERGAIVGQVLSPFWDVNVEVERVGPKFD